MNTALATFVALLLAHLLADFILQTRAMVWHKRRPGVFAAHIATVAITAVATLGAGPHPIALGVVASVAGLHAVIDAIKTWLVPADWLARHRLAPLQVFALDQGAHMVSLIGLALIAPATMAGGIWAQVLDGAMLRDVLRGMVALSGVILATRVGALVVGLLMDGLSAARDGTRTVPADHAMDEHDAPAGASVTSDDDGADRAQRLRAGVWIGWLERALVFTFVLLGQFNATGLVIAAKSILRFEYARKSAQSELVIIGTLASVGWAVAMALLTRAGWQGLA